VTRCAHCGLPIEGEPHTFVYPSGRVERYHAGCCPRCFKAGGHTGERAS
jgi:hypothetical protein